MLNDALCVLVGSQLEDMGQKTNRLMCHLVNLDPNVLFCKDRCLFPMCR